uniref:Poly [ADP-ribose] polymerase n=2 Tax=Cynoglossus semilaevis TaxID=244447 RepID=A0A3P8WRG8_CYNSE
MFPSGAVAASSPQCQGVFSKVVSSPGMYETKVGSVAIEVVSGDITKETSDVIVNSSNENFSLKSGVSKAVLEAAGPTVEAECLSLGAQVNTGLIMTQPGNLKCQKILHVVGQRDPVKVNKIVDDALQMCLKDSYRSVSFPAIGTGQGNVQAKLVADAMFDAVSNVLSQNPAGSLNKIRFVIFQQPMLKDFHNSMVEREQKQATKPKDTAEKEKETYSIWERFISLFGGGSSTKQTTREALVTVEAEPTHFHICGDSQAKVDLAKTWINDLINKEQHSNTISDLAIADFSNADQRILVDLQIKLGVRIILDNTTQPTLKIEGFSKDVLQVTATIYQMLKKVKEEEELKRDEEMAQTVAEWQYQQLQLQFQSFDSHNNFLLERAFQRRLPNVDITVQQCTYTVTMPDGPATDSQGNVLQIKRIDKLKGEEVPDHWAPMPATSSCHSVTIEAGSKEYTDVLTLFQASCKRNIIKIERIQNPVLWKSLLLKKRDMEQRNGHQNNERQLFHGTTHDIIKTVNEHGFNRSYAGKNAACYGNGTYFAVNASYSANDTYSKPNQNGEKCMYLCRVLTGDFTVGKANMITPPAKSSSSVQMYDSVVDNVATPSMFVIFHDTQACPEYLITFK